jgi:hypothetical protein
MKTKVITFVGLLVILCLSGSLVTNCSEISGIYQNKEKRDVGSFNKISLGISADLYLSQGSKTEVVIDAEERMMEYIITEVTNGNLKIKYDKWRVPRHKRIKIYITIPEIKGLNVSGSGDIIAETDINGEDIEFNISGSGKIIIDNLKVSDAEASISGSGGLLLAGSETLESFEISISGSGDMKAEKLKVDKFMARISGSGTCEVHVLSELTANISGSGGVYYAGNPIVDVRISGSGKVRPLQ